VKLSANDTNDCQADFTIDVDLDQGSTKRLPEAITDKYAAEAEHYKALAAKTRNT